MGRYTTRGTTSRQPTSPLDGVVLTAAGGYVRVRVTGLGERVLEGRLLHPLPAGWEPGKQRCVVLPTVTGPDGRWHRDSTWVHPVEVT